MPKIENTNIGFPKDAFVTADIETATDSSQAATCHAKRGRITSSTANLAADTVETLTITNKHSKTTSTILANVRGGGNAAGALSVCADPSAADGTFTLKVRNNTPATAASAAYIVDFVIINNLD